MAFDALGILKGLYGGVLVAMDESDVAATSLTVNTDGNVVVDISKTGAKGLSACLILTEAADADSYDDELQIDIQVSDYLDRNWETVASFPKLYTHIAAVTGTATTAFVAGDILAVLTQETTADTGRILWFDPKLSVIGGIGEIWVERDDAGDVFNQAAGKTLTSAVTGIATKTYGAGTTRYFDMQPGIYIRRFVSNKKYVRCSGTTKDDSFGKCWVMLTDNALDTL